MTCIIDKFTIINILFMFSKFVIKKILSKLFFKCLTISSQNINRRLYTNKPIRTINKAIPISSDP